jgi:hypothetical protein
MGVMIKANKNLVLKSGRKDYFGYLDLDRRILLKRMLKKQGVRIWNVFSWLRICPTVGYCGHSDILGSTKGTEFLD